MTARQRPQAGVDYAKLIARHYETRLSALSSGDAAEVLKLAALSWDASAHVVYARTAGPLTAAASAAYKDAVRTLFGESAYEMTRINFALAGCLCEHCKDRA